MKYLKLYESFQKGNACFEFVGKRGIHHSITLEDKHLVKILWGYLGHRTWRNN